MVRDEDFRPVSTRAWRACAAGASALAICVWTWLAGRDLGWDVLNHHLYIPFAWLNGRIGSDLHGAGPQLYQNPLGYLPFYAAVAGGLPSWAVGLTLALLHAANGLVLWLVCERLWGTATRESALWCGLAMLAALLAPVFLQVAGTSSSDPVVSIFVLLSLWLALLAPRSPRRVRIAFVSGLAMGLAFAIKQSAAVFVVALGVTLVWQWCRSRINARGFLACAGGGIAGIALGMGWYGWRLWREFGNPVFPLFNEVFGSPYAPTSPLEASRFQPDGWLGWMTRPFEMALPEPYIYVELFAPDIRLLCAVAFGLVLLSGWLVRRLSGRGSNAECAARWSNADSDLAVFCLVGYVLWQLTSGNGRYALALLLLAGLLAVRWAWVLLGPRISRCLLLLVIAIQVVGFGVAGDRRGQPEPWGAGPYYPVEIDASLQREAALHLVMGVQTHASLLVDAHRGGAQANPIGQLSLPLDDSLLGQRFERLLRKWEGRTRVLMPGLTDEEVAMDMPAYRRFVQQRLYRIGLRVDWSDCRPVTLRLVRRITRLVSCRVDRSLNANPAWDRELVSAAPVFERLEGECPGLYGPSGLPADRLGDFWQKFYVNSDTRVMVSSTDGVIALHSRTDARVLGSIEDVLKADRIACMGWSYRGSPKGAQQ